MDQEFLLLRFLKGAARGGNRRETRKTLLDRRVANTQHLFITTDYVYISVYLWMWVRDCASAWMCQWWL